MKEKYKNIKKKILQYNEELKCISDGKSKCICKMRGCKRLENLSDEEYLKLL